MNAMIKIEPSFYQRDHARLLAGVRQTHSMVQASEQIPAQWQNFMQFKQEFTGVMPDDGEVTYGVICAGDANGFEYMCAAEVDSFDEVPTNQRLKLKDQQYAVFVHTGHIAEIKAVWQGVWDWVASSEYEVAEAPCFEKYDQRYDAQTGSGGFEIWIPVTAI